MGKKFTPSPQQQALYSWINNPAMAGKSALVRAVAGAGKTTTLINALELMNGTIFFGAYNKKIAQEIQARAPQKPGLFIKTMHAAGLAAWRSACNNPSMKVGYENKCKDIFRDACARHPQYQGFEGAVLSLVSYAKQAAFGVSDSRSGGFIKDLNDLTAWYSLIEHFNVDCLGKDLLCIKLTKKVLEQSYMQDKDVVDFDDMIYAPLIHNARMYTHDWVLIDEAQDTNASRRELALRMLKSNGRLIAVGDEHQAIYGFTGADNDALDLIAKAVDAQDMPLTITYRCPKAVVKIAHRYVSHIEAAETAPEGLAEDIDYEKFLTLVKPGDAVLCRFNAPNVKIAYGLIAKGIPARVEGREIGEGLKKLTTRWKSKDFDALLSHLDDYQERETKKYIAKEQEARVDALDDTITCLKIVIARVQGQAGDCVALVSAEIDKIFGNDESKAPVVLLSSIHKSKGREFDTVFWLQAGPSKHARKEWELIAETNLCYVAATRAMSNLYLTAMPE
jgi:DNA helicase-2/ATP-dependent DNA helicase PcrA